jgi:hypothetical protein
MKYSKDYHSVGSALNVDIVCGITRMFIFIKYFNNSCFFLLFRSVKIIKYDREGNHRFGVIDKSKENKVWNIGFEKGFFLLFECISYLLFTFV